MQPTHLTQVYATEARIRHFAHLAHEQKHARHEHGHRNRFTRVMDAIALWARTWVPPLHWAGAGGLAFLLYLYARLVGATSRLTTLGAREWPDLPAPGILAIWHGGAPSLMVAVSMKKPRVPLVILISTEPRGDCLAILCRLLGLRVVRGSGAETGWAALAKIGAHLEQGACAIITPDGGGWPHVAKAGAVVLAEASGAPLIAAGASCTPAFEERRKWDDARNPLPFGRIAVALGEPRQASEPADAATLDQQRRWLQQQLDGMEEEARRALEPRSCNTDN